MRVHVLILAVLSEWQALCLGRLARTLEVRTWKFAAIESRQVGAHTLGKRPEGIATGNSRPFSTLNAERVPKERK